jgi:hypothetical protein
MFMGTEGTAVGGNSILERLVEERRFSLSGQSGESGPFQTNRVFKIGSFFVLD